MIARLVFGAVLGVVFSVGLGMYVYGDSKADALNVDDILAKYGTGTAPAAKSSPPRRIQLTQQEIAGGVFLPDPPGFNPDTYLATKRSALDEFLREDDLREARNTRDYGLMTMGGSGVIAGAWGAWVLLLIGIKQILRAVREGLRGSD